MASEYCMEYKDGVCGDVASSSWDIPVTQAEKSREYCDMYQECADKRAARFEKRDYMKELRHGRTPREKKENKNYHKKYNEDNQPAIQKQRKEYRKSHPEDNNTPARLASKKRYQDKKREEKKRDAENRKRDPPS